MAGKKVIKVSLKDQTVKAYEGEKVVFSLDCVTGDKDHPTDKGTFKILRRYEKYRSRKYDVQMDYAQFFTTDGKALHQYHGYLPLSVVRLGRGFTDSVGSHGCVRLSQSDAKALFKWGALGITVIVE